MLCVNHTEFGACKLRQKAEQLKAGPMLVEKQTVFDVRSHDAPTRGPADDGKRSEFTETWTVVLLRFVSVLVLMIIVNIHSSHCILARALELKLS